MLTDGREWSFYLPGAQGSYEDRRVYRLQVDDRDPAECESVLVRYLSRDRVRSGAAYEDAQRDYRDAAGKREASAALTRAWGSLLAEPEELLLELVPDKAEALCGFRPIPMDVLAFLRLLGGGSDAVAPAKPHRAAPRLQATPPTLPPPAPDTTTSQTQTRAASGPGQMRGVAYRLFGKEHAAVTGNAALVSILGAVCSRDPNRIPELAKAVEGRSRNHIARSADKIYPTWHERPSSTRAGLSG